MTETSGSTEESQPRETAGTGDGVSVDQLTADDTGQWLVTTLGSRHVWDLDAGTYQRIPGATRASFDWDKAVVRLTRVERWPAVGSTSFIWFDDPALPDLVEQWRQSSTIVSIEAINRPAG